jgi:hypothetical protein
MRSRYKILAGAALVVLLLLAIWSAFPGRPVRSRMSVGFTTASGHFPEPSQFFADEIVVLWVTNTGPATLYLDDGYVRFENAAGRLVRDYGPSWHQESNSSHSGNVLPGNAAWLASGFDRDNGKRRLQFVFAYHWDASPMIKGISKAVGQLPVNRLPQRTYNWLRRNGMVDGGVHRDYESHWIANPKGGASGRPPIFLDTNRISAPAASRGLP